MLRSLIAAACLYAAVSAPALAQVCVVSDTNPCSALSGPWPVYQAASHKARVSHGIPPRNARCGWYMGKITGHRDRSLWLAQHWARRFPRTSARPGAVVVWTRGGSKGHVAKIVSMRSRCRAVVHDNIGTYERDICRRVIAYVQP